MRSSLIALAGALAFVCTAGAQTYSPSSGVRYHRLLIRNALLIDGAGNPTRGPVDIVVEGKTITGVYAAHPVAESGSAMPTLDGGNFDRVIDATGMYVMPGIIDVHSHIQFDRGGIPMPHDYEFKLLLAHGITTIRDPGSMQGPDTIVHYAKLSDENLISAPTIIPYVVVQSEYPDSVRAQVRHVKAIGGKGLKVFINRPDVWDAISDEAHKLGLPIATDMKIQETDAIRASQLGVASIEHWYGIPDAATPGPQNFPDYYNYDNEADRFRWGGDIWRQADPARLSAVLDTMLAHHVTWDPTFAIYEANRDLGKAQNEPWFRDYALPAMLKFYQPNPGAHGSYQADWTTADEVMWRNNYRIWMHWVREYAARGGNVTVGSDAGFIYALYGFTTIREMEMQQEAGFHPLEVIQHATSNGAKLLGLPRTGVVRTGFDADLAIVDGNPLHNMKVLYALGMDVPGPDGKLVHRGGVRYTIKQGIVFDDHQLLADVRSMVRQARANTAGEKSR
ncbi:MAG TPA: amidohydrolase family protein [Gemmatimonadaceae bacterium]|nr:amidohydrolase family protein [Gemmatimonadaceae bacterium]